jgi:histidyl-tRNA synthetase
MEHLARRGVEPDAVAERILTLIGAPGSAPNGLIESGPALLPEFVARVGSADAARLASDLLALGGLPLDGGGRPPEEIVARLLEKAGRVDPTASVRAAIAFIARLHALSGPPDTALPELAALLREHGLETTPLDEVRQALEVFACYGSSPAEVVVDLSLGRGLWYYTGLVFEIYADGAGGPLQLCGGGRYDDLVRALGGREGVPACGFAFGLERVDLALADRGDTAPDEPGVGALVSPLEEPDVPIAIRAAELLRAAGIATELDVRRRGARAALRRADRAGIPVVVLVGEREREQGAVLLRRLEQRDEQRVPLSELVERAQAAVR